jgi:hypothetical protein
MKRFIAIVAIALSIASVIDSANVAYAESDPGGLGPVGGIWNDR